MAKKYITVKQILKIVNHPHIDLASNHDGYWYFIYDDGVKFDTHSVYVPYLHHLPIDRWVDEANAFILKMENE